MSDVITHGRMDRHTDGQTGSLHKQMTTTGESLVAVPGLESWGVGSDAGQDGKGRKGQGERWGRAMSPV